MSGIFIEAESFKNLGGWVVDTASMETIGSSYVMAHGMGIPVVDSETEFFVSEKNEYYIWALTRDWTASWNVQDPAGKFTVKIDGNELEQILGTNGAKWDWQLAGKCSLDEGIHTISLHDLSGFNGRCDAIYISTQSSAPITENLRNQKVDEYEKEFDLVVIGGGVAGVCTAISALRSGVNVALINDRGILGGCNSSEIRVCQGGIIHLPPYNNLGNIVKEIAPVVGYPSTYSQEYFEDARKLFAFEVEEGKRADYKIFLNYAVTDVECSDKTITAVICTNTLTGEKIKIKGTNFSDCSGDGIVARKAGCETMYGREAKSVFNESLAPSEHQNLVMGHSIRWYSENTDGSADFPDIDFNLKFDDNSCLNCTSGDWEQETGFSRNMVNEIEYIRDYGLRAIYSNWAYQKHHFKEKEKFSNLKLKWVSFMGGKRESYRVKGDYILTQNDIENKVVHPDATACLTWSIDMHFPEPSNAKQFDEPFRSFAYHRGIERPYPVPYRCLYAKDINNLFLGGRLVSTSHVAFSSVRVMRTLGCLGEVVGLAASVCKQKNCTPRDVYTKYLSELKALLEQGVKSPDAFCCNVENEEAYHFKDIGWWWLNTATAQNPEKIDKFKKGVESLSLEHKYPMPKEWKKL